MKVYLLPGLGADKRMYEPQLRVLKNAVVLEHLAPIKKQSIKDYAARIAQLIDTTQSFVLVGSSLGGIISLELTRFVKPLKVILISSVKSRSEMPAFIRSLKYVNLHRIVPGNLYKKFNGLMVKRLDNRRDSSAAQLIKDMTIDADPEFITWAIDAFVHWDDTGLDTSRVIHIHGTNDSLFPFANIRNAIAIQNGSHVMGVTKSDEVNRELLKALE